MCEAVALGVPAINIDPTEGLGLNYLPAYAQGELWERASYAEELLRAREKLLDKTRNADHKRTEKVRAFRNLIFGEPTVDKIVQAFDL